jgi:hypothetical protein
MIAAARTAEVDRAFATALRYQTLSQSSQSLLVVFTKALLC